MSSGMQPLTCKKCGRGGFYHPGPDDDIGTWHREDKFGNIQAFEEGFFAPHWYICPATVQGSEHREKMEGEMGAFQKREYVKKENAVIEKTPIHPPGQSRLASERLTPLDRKIAEKVNVMQMCIDDIKELLKQKADSDI